jgi:hypothetical protein
MFRLFSMLPSRTARTHAACVSFSFVYNVKQRGTFRLRYATDITLLPVPFSGMPADWSADRILNFHEAVGANRAPQALSERCIGRGRSKCQAPF